MKEGRSPFRFAVHNLAWGSFKASLPGRFTIRWKSSANYDVRSLRTTKFWLTLIVSLLTDLISKFNYFGVRCGLTLIISPKLPINRKSPK